MLNSGGPNGGGLVSDGVGRTGDWDNIWGLALLTYRVVLLSAHTDPRQFATDDYVTFIITKACSVSYRQGSLRGFSANLVFPSQLAPSGVICLLLVIISEPEVADCLLNFNLNYKYLYRLPFAFHFNL